MNRRQLLFGMGAAAVMAPAWIRQAFAYGPACPPVKQRVDIVRQGLAAAEAARKPLLVLTVPVVPSNNWLHGQAFGEWLNHGGDAALADLAQVEVVCAQTADLRQLVSGVAPIDPKAGELALEPLMRLIDGGKVTPLNATLDTPTLGERGQDLEDPSVDKRIAALAGLLRGALAPTSAARAERARAGLTEPERTKVQGALSGIPLALVDKAAADLSRSRSTDAGVVVALAQAARKRLLETAIPGSLWARSSGCGDHIEDVPDDEQMRVACGMGFVTARSRRFVRFYTECAG